MRFSSGFTGVSVFARGFQWTRVVADEVTMKVVALVRSDSQIGAVAGYYGDNVVREARSSRCTVLRRVIEAVLPSWFSRMSRQGSIRAGG